MIRRWVGTFILIVPVVAFAQRRIVRFEHLTTDAGLSQSTVQCLLKDSDGFMWFGTGDGLNRYDGYQYQIFKHYLSDSSSICSNSIRSAYEDSQGNLWFGTESGLCRYDKANGCFVNYVNDPDDPESIPPGTVQAILETGNNELWLGTIGAGLVHLDVTTGKFERLDREGVASSIAAHDVNSLLLDSKGNFWVGTSQNGLCLFDPASSDVRTWVPNPEDPESLPGIEINAIAEDRSGTVWLGTYGHGLARVVPTGSDFRFVNFKHQPGKNCLSNDLILSLSPSQSGIWIGTENGGLNYLDTATGRFTNYISDARNPGSLNNNSIYSVWEDIEGNVWAGTYAGGVNFANMTNQAFHLHTAPTALSYNSVADFSEGKDGSMWIATDGGGLNRFNRKTQSFEYYDVENSNLKSNAGLSVLEDSRGDVWLGTWSGGLNRLNQRTGQFDVFTMESCGLPTNNVFALFEDSKGRFWVNSFLSPGGLVLFDRDKGAPSKVFTQNNGGISSPNFKVIVEDRRGNLLLGAQGGLIIFNPETEKFVLMTKEDNLSHNTVKSILVDEGTIVWIGTQNGLNKWNQATNEIEQYFDKDGLPNNVIRGLEKDDDGNIWISTNFGICRFNPAKGTFRNFGKADGLQGNEFNSRASYRSGDGAIWFGGVNGFNVFNPRDVIDNTFIPPIALIDFQIFNKPVPIGTQDSPLPKHISQVDQITLSYKESVFSFSFSALNFSAPDMNQYAYMMEGFEDDWNYVGADRKATYTNLNAGDYIFRVKGSNNHGYWNEEGTSVKITITPPFQETLWFRSIVLITLAGAIIGFFRKEKKRREGVEELNKQLQAEIRHGKEAEAEKLRVAAEAAERDREAQREQQRLMQESAEKDRIAKLEIQKQRDYLERNVAEILEKMERFSAGDLTASLKVKSDDSIGRLFAGFNNSIENIRQMLHEVAQAVQASVYATSAITASTEQLASGAQEQSSQAQEASEAVKVMNTNIHKATEKANQVAQDAASTGSVAEAGGKAMQQTVQGIEEIDDVVKKAAERVTELGRSSDQIGKVIKVISGIADQTTLLAVNASIESARAGIHGKGFAVVANEVRALSEKTTIATRDISNMIVTIQEDVQDVVSSIAEGTKKVTTGKQLAREAMTSLENILAGMQTVVDDISEVAETSKDQSNTTQALTGSLDTIRVVSGQAACGAQDVASSSEKLSRLIDHLQIQLNKFRFNEEVNPRVTVVAKRKQPV